MPLDFPANPQPGDTYAVGNTVWTWEPPRWTAISAVQGPPGPQGPEGPEGPVNCDEGAYPLA
jgi:hypothetical protein